VLVGFDHVKRIQLVELIHLTVIGNLDIPAESIIEDLGSETKHLVNDVDVFTWVSALHQLDHWSFPLLSWGA
jgi:hypothetical protein